VKKPKAVWLKPTLLVDVEYRALTGTGKLRHPSFKGIREDL
jgi:bifunctional non-homologous end joining protein LigD